MDIVVLAVLVVGFVFVSCLLGIIAFTKLSGFSRRLNLLQIQLDRIINQQPAKAEPTPRSQVETTELNTKKVDIEPPVPVPVVPVTVADSAVASHSLSFQAKPKRDVEQALASRWFVWIGGAAVALGGLLLIKYAHDHGLISPALRVMLGLVFAAVLIAAGEYVRRSRGAGVVDYVPAALSAAGLVTAFGSVYAAHALYALVPGGVAFIGLGLVALAAFALSGLQGPLIAALGLLGAYVAPMLVTSDNPNAWSFFPYIFVIVAASFYTLRGRNWWWLGYLALAGALVWSLLWINGGAFEVADVVPIGLFALALGTFATLSVEGRNILGDESGNLSEPIKMSHALRLAVCGMSASSAILATQVFAAGHGFTALLIFAIGMALLSIFSWFKKGWSGAVLMAAALTLFVLMGWQEVSTQLWAMDESGMWSTVPGLIVPPLFRNWMFVALAAFGGIGAYGYWRKAVRQPWAILASGSAVLFLFGAWARVDFLMGQGSWAAIAFTLAAALFALGYFRRQSIVKSTLEFSTGVLIIGSALLSLFALDRMLNDVWYTMAVAALAAAVAWTSRILPVRFIGAIASALGSFATIRLFVSREFWNEPTNLPLGAHWPLYGYGVTAALLWWGSRQLGNDKYRRYSVALEGLSLGLAISLISLELRVLIGGGIVNDHVTLLEMSAHILAWLGAAYGLAYRQQLYSSFVSLWGSRILLAGSCAAIAGLSLVILNPLITAERIEGGALINTLWLAYLGPVVLLALMARKMESLGLGIWRGAIGIMALVLVVAFVTLETKRLFQGPYLIPEFVSDAESYALSAAWLVTAVVLFIAGLSWNRQTIRYGGLAVMVLALLKTFAYDLWQLGGLWQIASVMGIGLSLIGIGWLYTRFVRAEPA
jgi:uncharacterized membrane protein